MKKNKLKVVILEGVDCSGKTTIKNLLNKKSNYKYLVIDRFLGSSYVYNHNNLQTIINIEKEMCNFKLVSFYLILLEVKNKNILKERLLLKNEKISAKKIKIDKKRFNKYFLKSPFKKIKIYNDYNLEDNVNKIINFLENE